MLHYITLLRTRKVGGEADLSFEHIAELRVIHESGCGRYLGNMHLGVQQEGFGIMDAFQQKITVGRLAKALLK